MQEIKDENRLPYETDFMIDKITFLSEISNSKSK